MSQVTRRSVIATGLWALTPLSANAAEWPSRPITMVHGFPPGGTVDLVTRVISDRLSKRLGQPVVVESRTGASGTRAAAQVARASPDGYTLFAIPSGHVIVGATFKSLPYRTVDDFSPIGTTTEFPYVLVTNSDNLVRTFQEFVELGRSRVSPLLFGSPGNGSGPHLAIERLAKLMNIRAQHIPYRGSSAAVVDLVGKRLDFMMDPPGPLLPHIKDGTLRALAVTGGSRFFGLPDVPTLQEAGASEYTVTSWQALIAPVGLPAAIQARLNNELNGILREPDVVQRFRSLGLAPQLSTPSELKARMESELAGWNAVVEATKFERI